MLSTSSSLLNTLTGLLLALTVLSACGSEEDTQVSTGCVDFRLLNPEITGVAEVSVLFATNTDGSNSVQFTLNRSNPSREFCGLTPGEYVYLVVEGTTVVGEGTVMVSAGSTRVVSP